jgi:hypothetical protein
MGHGSTAMVQRHYGHLSPKNYSDAIALLPSFPAITAQPSPTEARLINTPSPWTSYVEGRDHTSGSNFVMVGNDDEGRGEDIELTGATVADQDFIANARQDIPRLLAEVRRLRGK